MIYFGYNLILTIFAPVLCIYGVVRSLVRGVPISQIRERFGYLPTSFEQVKRQPIWVHAVSVGEVVSVEPLLRHFKKNIPRVPIYLSTTTPEGRQIAKEKLAELTDGVFWMPFDFTFAVSKCLTTLRPRLVVIAETEIWPNLFRLSRKNGSNLMIVNGRMSDRSAVWYERFSWFFAAVLHEVSRIIVQSEEDRERFIAAGASEAKISVGGNLKYDSVSSDESLMPDIENFLNEIDSDPILIAGSTREHEERPILEAFCRIAQNRPRALLILAPRHPSRFREVGELVEDLELPFVRRSELSKRVPLNFVRPTVMLLDSVGELAALYKHASLVFIGGSLNGWGGHNLLEPAVCGCPVVVGPYMQNFRLVTEDMLRNDSILQIPSDAELVGAFEDILSDPRKAAELAERAKDTAERHTGAARRMSVVAMELYRKVLVSRYPSGMKSLVLKFPAKLWEIGVRVHAAIYTHGVRKCRQLNVFTLCVGNVTVGGTGKTPTVVWITEALNAMGLYPAVLTRGYRRVNRNRKIVAMPGEPISTLDIGDEAQLLLQRFSEKGLAVPVAVGADRYRAGMSIKNTLKPDLFVLDDGLQHHRLHKDFNLVLIDVDDPFGSDAVVPLGRLREPLSGLTRASAFLLTHTQSDHDYSAIEQRLQKWNQTAPIYRSRVDVTSLRGITTGEDLSFDSLEGLPSLAFAGLGNPYNFFRSVDTLGARLTRCLRYPDHHRYTMDDINRIVEVSQKGKAQCVITTEKDLINLCHAVQKTCVTKTDRESILRELFATVPLVCLSVQIRIEQGERLIQQIISANSEYETVKG